MSNPNLAILSNLSATGFLTRATASPYALCLGTGLVGASYLAWGAGTSAVGVGLLKSDKERSRAGLSADAALKSFGLGASALTSLSFIAAAFQIPPSSFTEKPRQVRNFIFGIAGVWLVHGLYGMAVMLPTSSRLLTLRKQLDARDTSLTPVQANEADGLLGRWGLMQWGRVALGGLGWLGAVAAYLSI